MIQNTVKPEPYRPVFPNMKELGEDEYIISWRIKDMNHIHHIQDYFGMPHYTTVNRLSKIKIRKDDPKWNDFLDGIRKGFYWAYRNQTLVNVKV